tara:strand:+ start:1305 stop:1436 length:132 start_codon:yes stop_codon:yes gene_type:complete
MKTSLRHCLKAEPEYENLRTVPVNNKQARSGEHESRRQPDQEA